MFFTNLSDYLKNLEFKKRNNYWYKYFDGVALCVNYQKSQWDCCDYYINIGFAYYNEKNKFPTYLHWFAQHRCIGKKGDTNIAFEEFLQEMANISSLNTEEKIVEYLEKNKICVMPNSIYIF